MGGERDAWGEENVKEVRLEDLELFAAGLFHHLCAAGLIRLGQLGALSACRGDRYNESDCHIVSSVRRINRRDVANASQSSVSKVK